MSLRLVVGTLFRKNFPAHRLLRLPKFNSRNLFVSLASFNRLGKQEKLSNNDASTISLNKDTAERFIKITPDEDKPPDSLKSMRYSLWFLGICFTSIGGYLVLEYGKPRVDADGTVIDDEFSDLPVVSQYFKRSIQQVRDITRAIQAPSREKLLPDVLKHPYYQPPFTLVLELTDVMIHPEWTYQTGWRFKKRPGLDYLLENLAAQGLYEIVVYTAEQGMTVFPIIESLDPKNLIAYKLVRDTTHFIDGHHVKDLSKLNRDLSKVIVVDWNPSSVKFHPENLLNIGRWDGQDNDQALVDLTSFLKTIAVNDVQDVREVLKYYQQYDDPLGAFRQKQREYYEMEEQSAKIKKKNSFMFGRKESL